MIGRPMDVVMMKVKFPFFLENGNLFSVDIDYTEKRSKKETMKRVFSLLLALVMCWSLVACSADEGTNNTSGDGNNIDNAQDNGTGTDQGSDTSASHYPVTVTTYDQNGQPIEQTFDKRPERVISVSQSNTEMLLYLGLGDLIVATAHRTSEPWEETAAEYEALNFLAQDAYPSKEVVISLDPDLIVGWGSLFADDALGGVESWNDMGVQTYLMKNTVSGLGKRNFEYLIEDLNNFGLIFDIQDQTDALIQEIRERLAAVEEQTGNTPMEDRPTVLTVQMLKDNEWFARANTDLTANIIELAGGNCLDEEYGYASMEVLIDKNPDAILVIDRETNPAKDTIQGLKNNPVLADVPAIKNDNFYVITHASFYCGSLRTVEDIEGLAALLHK